jgi:glycosyltransferase involved in cell wall biosynthesis
VILKSIVIPTRNRPILLNRVVAAIIPQLSNNDEIIIVDSSDSESMSENLGLLPQVKYISTHIRSAAVQRNIGLEQIADSKYVFFLDDDVLPGPDYFTRCVESLNASNAIGLSGIAVNSSAKIYRTYPNGLIGFYHRIFQLDSNKDGVLLHSGVNIPVRDYQGKTHEVDWLIGCSIWSTEKIGATRFESDFLGQSLSEDVIFSIRMSKKGRLVTDSSIVLIHDESDIARPSKQEFWKMWMTNRYRLIQVANFGMSGKISYWWANFGQCGILCYSKIKGRGYKVGSLKGLMHGALLVLKGK